MKKIIFALMAFAVMPVFLVAEQHVFDKVEGYHAEWTLTEEQEIEIQEMVDHQMHDDGIYVERSAQDPRFYVTIKVESDFGKRAIEKKTATFYDVTIEYNYKLKNGVITIKSDLENYKSHDVQLSKILIDLWKPLCFEMIDQKCIMPKKDKVRVRNAASTLEFHYHPSGN